MVILTAIITSGCVAPEPVITQPDAIYIGDSNCELFNDFDLSAAEQSGLPIDCKIGRRLVDIPDSLPSGYRIIFLALGTNDANSTTIQEYSSKLDLLLGSTSSEVWCVLPAVPEPDNSRDAVRLVMMNQCANTIDPLEAGVTFSDGIHFTQSSQALHANQIRQVI